MTFVPPPLDQFTSSAHGGASNYAIMIMIVGLLLLYWGAFAFDRKLKAKRKEQCLHDEFKKGIIQ